MTKISNQYSLTNILTANLANNNFKKQIIQKLWYGKQM